MEPTTMLPSDYEREVDRMSRLIRPGAVFRYTRVSEPTQPQFEMDILACNHGRVKFSVCGKEYLKYRSTLAMNMVDCLAVRISPPSSV